MRRLLAVLGVLAVAALFGFALAEHPGRASLDWAGWRVDTSGAALLILGLGVSLLLAAFWRLVGWLATAPARGARNRDETRRRKALDALTRGFLALAAGDVQEADRQARQATSLDGAAPALSNLLAGQAAEARGDDGAAQLAYAALLNDPDSRPAAQRALRRLALRHGDDLAAETPTASSTGVPGSTVGGSP